MLPRVSDGQLLFLLNNVSKMKERTELGNRISEVHNGSSLFTGDAGQGESNARRYMIFATVQNKMHYAAHKHTAADAMYERVDNLSRWLA